MRLINRSHRAANAVRNVSPSGELFVASIVICMILSAFGDAVDPTWFSELGLEFAFFDLGGEFSILAMRHWHLLELLLAGRSHRRDVVERRIGAVVDRIAAS